MSTSPLSPEAAQPRGALSERSVAEVPTRLRPARAPGRAWAVVAMVAVLMAVDFADKQVLGLAADPIRHEFGLDAAAYGMVSGSFYLLFSVSALAVGFVSNRVRTTRLLTVMAVAWALTALPVLVASSVPMLYLSRILLGAAEGPAMPVAVHAVHKWFPEHNRAVPTALVQFGGALGVAVAGPVLGHLIAQHGWRSAFATLALVSVVWVVVWPLVGREGPLTTYAAASGNVSAADSGPATPEPRLPYRRLLLNGSWLGTLAAGLGAYWTLAVGVAWLPTYLEKSLGRTTAETGRLVAAPALVAAVAIVVVPWLSATLMRRGASGRLARGLVVACTAAASGVCLLILPIAHGSAAVALMALGFGLPNAVFPLFYLISAQITPVAQRGAVLALGTAIATLAGVAAPGVTGRLIDQAASTPHGLHTGLVVAAVLTLAGGALCAFAVDPERDARRLGLLP
ncbi:MFS transporter [Streptomyces sp. NPDC057694]|uniref:MFS transporter n=1 Tax=Streptomyces sp. NPDC057694 TaxID=3346216 RepID=UPI0036B9B022